MRWRCHRKKGAWTLAIAVFLCGHPGQPDSELLHLKSTLLTKESFEPRS